MTHKEEIEGVYLGSKIQTHENLKQSGPSKTYLEFHVNACY